MKIDFSGYPPMGIDKISQRFCKNIRSLLLEFIDIYTPYLGDTMTRIISNFTDDPVENFDVLVRGISWEPRRIKKDAKESDNPLADVEGLSSL